MRWQLMFGMVLIAVILGGGILWRCDMLYMENAEYRNQVQSNEVLREKRDEHARDARAQREARDIAEADRREAEATGEDRADEARAAAAENQRLREQLAAAETARRLAEIGQHDAAALLDGVELCPSSCYQIGPAETAP